MTDEPVASPQEPDGNQHEPGTDSDSSPEDERRYPTLTFETGEFGDRGDFDLRQSLTREETARWLEDVAAAMRSHGLGVESPDKHVRLGLAPDDVQMSFSPDGEFRGELEVTFRIDAAVMFVADDPTKPRVGARGGVGFIPLEMLTTDRDPGDFRCYNWIDDPLDP